MDEIGVRLHVWRLFCYRHGAEQRSAVPYLWVVGFKLDGSTLHQRLNRLSWRPQLFLGNGDRGNLAVPCVDPGMKISVPRAVGTWHTTLSPVTLHDEQGHPTVLPGTLGFVVVVLEEHDLPANAVETGHHALNQFVREQVTTFVAGLDLVEFRAAVRRRVDQGRPGELALRDELLTRFDVLERLISGGAGDAVSDAMRHELGVVESVWADLDKDEPKGIACHLVSADDLLAEPDFTLDFADHLPNRPRPPENRHYAYNLRSYLRAQVCRRAVDPRLPSGHDIEIQGVARRLSTSLGMPYIYEVGGVHDGRPWWLSRSEAALLIAKGERSFHAHTTDGARIPVTVLSPPESRWSYLTTTPDGQSDNRLLSLPDLNDVPGFFRSVYEPDTST